MIEKDPKNRQLTIVVGAGSTYSDAYDLNLPIDERPPLDRGFFNNITKSQDRERVDRINEYFKENYGFDILDEENDAIENAMRYIYVDLFNLSLKEKAENAYNDLLFLYNKRIAETTNHLGTIKQLNLYKILDQFLSDGYLPEKITFVTYNHDLQIEKILEELNQTEHFQRYSTLDVFPSYYLININKSAITKPKDPNNRIKIFKVNFSDLPTIKILKMHGSLNWYSFHKGDRITHKSLADSDRRIWLTQRKEISLDMKVSEQIANNSPFMFPIIVPPVIHKSEIFHDDIKMLWKHAETALQTCNDLVIFGYSCSALDFESSNLFKRACRKNSALENITIIDPSSEVLKRYVDLLKPRRLSYYTSAKNFIENVISDRLR
jgi:hypothetical protein